VVERRVGRGSGVMSSPRTAAGQATMEGPVEGLLAPRPAAPEAQAEVMGMATPAMDTAPAAIAAEEEELRLQQEAPARPVQPTPDVQPSEQVSRLLAEIARTAPKPKLEGTIDISSRIPVQNADGSTSTLRTISIGTDEGEVLIPTISPDGLVLTEEEAIRLYENTGQHLGIFSTPEEAIAYAEILSAKMKEMPTRQPTQDTRLNQLEFIPEGLQRALDNWNTLLPETRNRYIEAGQSDIAELIQSEATPDDVIFAGDLDGWVEGIRNGTYNVGDLVAYDTGQGFYTVTVIRPYDVRTIRREQ